MPKIRPYLSIDLETTGLNVDKAQILQVGFVIDDGVSPIDLLKKDTFFVENDTITYAENYALGMNAWIFQELMKKSEDRKYETRSESTRNILYRAIIETAELAYQFDVDQEKKYPSRKIQIAGKNPGTFDWQIILNHFGKDFAKESVDHRFIDAGAVFFGTYGRNPSLNEINKLIEHKPVSHDALDDALNVVIALRHAANFKPQEK